MPPAAPFPLKKRKGEKKKILYLPGGESIKKNKEEKTPTSFQAKTHIE